jgi:hypothetical protein
MTRTFLIAIAAILFVLAASHAQHAIVNDRPASFEAATTSEN